MATALTARQVGLPSPHVGGLFAQWSLQPLALAAAVAVLAWYLVTVRAARAQPDSPGWPARRVVVFVGGVTLFAWTTCGWLEAYRGALYWAWTAQTLALLLVLPIVVLAGQPVQLARLRSGRDGIVQHLLRSRVGRFLGNPLVGPALVPLLSAALFFGPVPEWTVRWDAVAWVLQLLLVVVGAFIVLPLVGLDVETSSLAVGFALGVGLFELVLDSIPGIVLRLRTTTVTDYFGYRASHGWTPSALHDQQTAGAILWCVAELIDIPFLLLAYRRWLAADAREAAQADAVLEAERAARLALARSSTPDAQVADEGTDGGTDGDAPWWLTDPQMRRRGYGQTRS